MTHGSDDQQDTELVGALRWNEFEGGFWSLDIEPPEPAGEPRFGGRVVLGTPRLPAGAVDGCRVRVRGRAREDMLDFFMAGTRFDAHEVELLPPS